MRKNRIDQYLEDWYGVYERYASPTTILWAATMVMDRFGADVAKRDLKAINNRREKRGSMIACPEYGDKLFG
jgi:hypothetical protein